MNVKSIKSNKMLYFMLFLLFIIGLIIFSNFVSISDTQEVLFEQMKKGQLVETEFAATQIENHVLQVRDDLVTLSKFPIMESLSISSCSGDMKIIHEKIEGKINSLLKIDKDGNIVESSSPDFSDYLGLNVRNKDYFKVPLETNGPFITVSRQGTPQVIVSAPLFKTTEYTPYPNFVEDFDGVLMSIIEPDHLYNLYIHPFARQGKSFFLLVDSTGTEVLLKSSAIEDYSSIKEQLPLKNGFSEIVLLEETGKSIVTSSDIILGSETWRLIVITPLQNIWPEVDSLQKKHLFSLGLVIIIIISIFFFLIFLYRSKEEVQHKLDKTNVTLKSLGINIQLEKNKFNQAELSLDAGKLYLIKQDEENHVYELFINSLNRGFAGLGIVRENPEKIRKKYGLHKTSFIWLTTNKAEGIPSETDIANLYSLISEFVKKVDKSVILLDRLDYILSENKFQDVIKKIHSLKDLASSNNCIIILSVNPALLEHQHLRAIEEEAIDLYGKHLRKQIELSDLEVDILRYINERNLLSKLASYRDITNKFHITKPTTRTKLNKLQGLGLVTIEQKGRFKSIKINSAGRGLI